MLSRINERTARLATMIILVFTVLTCLCYLTIFINPYMPLNPFPPPTNTPRESPTPPGGAPAGPTFPPTWTPTHTATPTDTPLPTDTPTVTPTRTHTPAPTFTPTATRTPAPPPPSPRPPTATRTHTPIPSPTPWPFEQEGYLYKVRNDKNAAGCNWLGVGGQVFDARGIPLPGVTIRCGAGGWEGLGVSGTKSEYGLAGWEVYLYPEPIDRIWYCEVVQAGVAVSPRVQFATTTQTSEQGCDQNLILLDFRKTS